MTLRNPSPLSYTTHPLNFTLLSKNDGCAEDCYGYRDGNHGDYDYYDKEYWPHKSVRVYLVEGELAKRISKRIENRNEALVYYIEENESDYIYSIEIKENSSYVQVRVGDFTKDFKSNKQNKSDASVESLLQLLHWLSEGEVGLKATLVSEALGINNPIKERANKYFKAIL